MSFATLLRLRSVALFLGCLSTRGEQKLYFSKVHIGACPSGNYEIDKSWTEIAESALRGCGRLRSVKIHDQILSIGDWAFRECSLLNSISMGKGVKAIGIGGFAYCKSLKVITTRQCCN